MSKRTLTPNDSETELGHSLIKGLVLLAAGLISGCASTVYDGRYAWRDAASEKRVAPPGDALGSMWPQAVARRHV